MALHSILKMGEPGLLARAEPVTAFNTPELELLVADLWETMHSRSGAGLAAPQIGVPLQVVVFGTGMLNPRYPEAEIVPPTVLLNPTVTPMGATMEDGWEGCLSVPGLRGLVPRYAQVRYQGFDQHGDSIDRTVDGFHARLVQHECDHLWGFLYPMRMKDMAQFGFVDTLFPQIADAETDID